MKKNLGIILGTALAMDACNTKLKASPKKPRKEVLPKPEKKNTYTEFIPNPKNKDYRRKYLGVKKRNFKNK